LVVPKFIVGRVPGFIPLRIGKKRDSALLSGRTKSPRYPAVTYVICTSPRSGSWLLSIGLLTTRLAGDPREWFNAQGAQRRRAQWGIGDSSEAGDQEYLDQVRLRSTTRNGVSGLKLQYGQFLELQKFLARLQGFDRLPVAPSMAKAFPNIRYVWLTRRDKARQAISFFLAQKTGRWWIVDGAETESGDHATRQPDFDAQAVAELEKSLIESDSGWRSYFEENNITPLTIYYEDIVADFRGAIVAILKWLGIPNADAVDLPPPHLKRQSTSLNEEWLQQYMAFTSSPQSSVRAT
jgi:trehalose 2-sulfotransferase